MIDNEFFPLKHLSFWVLIISCGLIYAYFVLVALISVWVGISNSHKDGFCMPILAGTISIAIISWLFLRFTKFILNLLKEKDIINIEA